jgi:hypothetical protein
MSFLKILSVILIALVLVLSPACQGSPQTSPPDTAAPPTIGSSTTIPGTSPATGASGPSTTVNPTTAVSSITPPSVSSGIGKPPITNLAANNVGTINKIDPTKSAYVVFAWNDLGMHCANPSFDTAVLLPPYNTVWAQVIKRGNPPQIVTQGITAEYKIVNNTYSYGKGSYAQFWDNLKALFGVSLDKNKGLNVPDPSVHNGLSGAMAARTDHFEAVGIPLTPIDDSNTWNPYQVAEITIKDASGSMLAQTRAMAPVSDEINCSKCHGTDAFNDILKKHDQRNKTNLQNQKPVLCASCHADPALGQTRTTNVKYLSDSMHGFHATVSSPPTCYDCHPGQSTQCSRSTAHTSADGNCVACHGNLSQVSTSIVQGRTPWASEPKCVTCHSGVAQVDTSSTLYRNATGHGSVYCASCHSSPHAMVPTSQQADNYQALQYQGKAVPMADCAACHRTSKGGGNGNLGEYIQTHGGTRPERANGCYICHTAVNTTDTSKWPHSFQWKSR